MIPSVDLSKRYTTREPRPRHLGMRSTWARWATRQAKAAQAMGDRDSARLFLDLARGLADVTVNDLRTGTVV